MCFPIWRSRDVGQVEGVNTPFKLMTSRMFAVVRGFEWADWVVCDGVEGVERGGGVMQQHRVVLGVWLMFVGQLFIWCGNHESLALSVPSALAHRVSGQWQR